jgi:2-desacetyl-2-hydroxyethyl bacteriochlorophyllide A dehydrogenase
MKTEAIVVGTDGKAGLQEVDLPGMSDTRVRVQTLLGGVSCGTEADCASGRAAYMKRPYISGYQAVGTVLEVGKKVDEFRPGDLVVTNGGGLWGMTSLAGGSHARQSVAEAAALIRLNPETASLATASYGVLAAIAYEGLSRMKLESGKVLGIFGLGMLGQLAGSIGRILGLRVIGINRSEWKCAAAKKLGFDAVCPPEAEAVKTAAQSCGAEGVHYAFDTTGKQRIFDLALQTLARGGELTLDGYYPEKFTVDFDICHGKNIRIHNPVGPGSWLPEVVKLTETGGLNIDPLITHTVAPAHIADFYSDLVANHSKYLGVVIDWRK